jgi:hypothetical protein
VDMNGHLNIGLGYFERQCIGLSFGISATIDIPNVLIVIKKVG